MIKLTLPTEWTSSGLEDLFVHVIGGDWGKDEDFDDNDFVSVTCIRGSELRHWDRDKGITASSRKVKRSSLEKRKLQGGDILIEISGGGPEQPVGRTVLVDEQALSHHKNKDVVCTNFLRLARPSQAINASYLNNYLKSFYLSGEVINYQGGSNNLRNLKFKDYVTIKVPFPPFAEQQQIAARLDIMLAQVDTIKGRLDALPAILKRFRQSVLASAVSGKLTEEWRGSKDFPIPECIGSVAIEIRYGTSKKCLPTVGKIPVLRIPNIGTGRVILDDLKYADFDSKELEKLRLEIGDLLLIRSNGSVDMVGKLAVITEADLHCLFAGYLIRIRLNKEKVNPNYAAYCLQSPQIRQVIELKSRSTSGVNNINSQELGSLEIPLPPLQEQAEIVRRVEQLFAFADKVEQRVNDAQTRVNHLTQSILAKAFRGELTADWRQQNPDLITGENSAEALLARIQAERAAQKPVKRAVKKTANKKAEA